MSEEEKPRLGRPPNPIDWKTFEGLCQINCTHEELSNILRISKKQLYERAQKEYGETFPTVYKRFSDTGKASLRRDQLKMAKKHVAMSIWMGKQLLGQKEPEKREQDQGHIHAFAEAIGMLAKGADPLSAEERIEFEALKKEKAQIEQQKADDLVVNEQGFVRTLCSEG
jgi:hypothetical protein